MYPFVAKIQYWDDIDSINRTAYHLIYGSNFAHAAELMESYYDKDLLSLSLTAVADTGYYFTISEADAIRFIEKEGDISE